MSHPAHAERVSVVIMTRDRRQSLLRTLDELSRRSAGHPVIVVDNGSSDGTPAAVRARHPGVRVLELGRNHGSLARNAGAAAARTPYIAFCDDDSWWADGALDRAADLLDAHPRLALLAARVLVGPTERLDPVAAVMATSALPPAADLPGPRVLGFLACGAVLRRDAFLAVGGFHPLIFFLGEETLLAQDLATAGWGLCYAPDVVAHHHPAAARFRPDRARLQLRNWLLSSWLRRPLSSAATDTVTVLRSATAEHVRAAVLDAVRGLPTVVRGRRRLPESIEADLRTLERSGQWFVPLGPGR